MNVKYGDNISKKRIASNKKNREVEVPAVLAPLGDAY